MFRAMASASAGVEVGAPTMCGSCGSWLLRRRQARLRKVYDSSHRRRHAQLQHHARLASPPILSFESVTAARYLLRPAPLHRFCRSPSRAITVSAPATCRSSTLHTCARICKMPRKLASVSHQFPSRRCTSISFSACSAKDSSLP